MGYFYGCIERHSESYLFNNDNCGNIVSFLDFQSYGKARIKSFKCSPDGLVQVCLQWAYRGMHDELPGFAMSRRPKQFLWTDRGH